MLGNWFFYQLDPGFSQLPKEPSAGLRCFERDPVYTITGDFSDLYPPELNLPLTSRFIVPAFLYREKVGGTVKKKPASLYYPETVNYKREGSLITITRTEMPLPPGTRLQLPRAALNVPSRGLQVELSSSQKKMLLSDKSITLQLGVFQWHLESRIHYLGRAAAGFAVQSYTRVSYPTLKSVLDPNGGYERLLQDVMQGRFADSSRLKPLLDILRTASEHEEREILGSVYEHDYPLFELVTSRIFSENILPYLASKEVSEVLAQMDDFSLAGALANSRNAALYERFLSRNRREELWRLAAKMNKPDLHTPENENTNSVWQQIAAVILNRRPGFIYVPDRSLEGRDAVEPSQPEQFESPYLAGGQYGFTLDWGNSQLWLGVHAPSIAELHVFFDVRQGEFDCVQLLNPFGFIGIPTLARKPRTVIGGGFSKTGEFFEFIFVSEQ